MYSTALTIAAPSVSAQEQQALLKPAPLVSLYEAFAVVPDPRSRHGLRYDLPYLLTCLVTDSACSPSKATNPSSKPPCACISLILPPPFCRTPKPVPSTDGGDATRERCILVTTALP